MQSGPNRSGGRLGRQRGPEVTSTGAVQNWKLLDGTRDEIRSIHKRSTSQGTLIFGTTEVRQKIVGIDYGAETDFRQNLQLVAGSFTGSDDANSVILPQETAAKLGVKVGETVIFKSLTVSGQQNVTELKLIATMTSQSLIGVSSGYANLASVNAQIGLAPQQYQTVNVWLKNMETIDSSADRIYASLAAVAPVYERANAPGSDPMKNMFRMFNGSGNQAVGQNEAWTGTKFRMATLNELMAQFMMVITTIDQIGFWIFVIHSIYISINIYTICRLIFCKS